MNKKLIDLARMECHRHVDVGPFKTKNYCSGEPRETGRMCLMTQGIPCRYFRDAVLPLRPELKAEWEAFLKDIGLMKYEDMESSIVLKSCACGKRFKPGSNRQTSCRVCSAKQRKMRQRARSKRYREQKASALAQCVTL